MTPKSLLLKEATGAILLTSCSHASLSLLVWEMFGGFPTFATRMVVVGLILYKIPSSYSE